MVSRRTFVMAAGAAALPAMAKTGQVELGVCGSVDDLEKADRAGFDYFEPAVAAIAALSDAEFQSFRNRVMKSRLRCVRFNSFIRTLMVVGTAVDRDALSAYMNAALDRCRDLGGKIVVWGSAGSRNVPEGYSRETANQQIRTFLRQAGDIAQKRGIVIAIEPLRKQESNILNTGGEAFEMVRQVDHPNVKMIIDYYHLQQESEDPTILEKAHDAIVHLHFANPNGRVWPKDAAEDPGYRRFFELVKKTGYRGGLSIEGKGSIDTDAASSLAFFQRALA